MHRGSRKRAGGFVLLSSFSSSRGSGPCKATQTPYMTCAQTASGIMTNWLWSSPEHEGTPTAQLCTGSSCARLRAVLQPPRPPTPHPLFSPLPLPGSLQGLLFQPCQSVYLAGLKGRSWQSNNRLQLQRRSLFAALSVGLSLVRLFHSHAENAHL